MILSDIQTDYKDKLKYKRINVVGTSSSGKTTFSKFLSNILGIDHIEMDGIFWGPNWYWPSDEEFFSKLREALKKDAWVLDGNYTRSIPIKWKKMKWLSG
jgi:adenylate kinase family enzyme